jgi:DNA ligase-1
MLAKSYKEVSKMDWNKDWYISTKLDGVRAMIFKKDGVIQTSSRGGKDYNIPATHILNDPSIIKIFEEHPDIVLDGELYIHGKPLSYISGLCRLEELDEKHMALQFHCYDIVNESLIFSERLSIINTFVPSEKLVIVPHIKTSTESTIMEYHNNFVANGYEGAVIRDPKKEYKCGARDARMVKLKMFTDDEFEIIGLVDGLRDEDMCFLMKTKEGNEFKAKPMGDRALKQWYRANIDSIIGKMGTVKYFGFTNTDKPVPNLPVFKSIRDNKDINE